MPGRERLLTKPSELTRDAATPYPHGPSRCRASHLRGGAGLRGVWRKETGRELCAIMEKHLPFYGHLNGRLLAAKIGSVSPGVSLVSLGLLLSQQTIRLTGEVISNVLMKLLAQPALMGLLVLLLAARGQAGREMIVLGALPTASMAAMIALPYKAYTAESSATVLLSTVLSVLTLAGVIALIP